MINDDLRAAVCISSGAVSLAPLTVLARYTWPNSLSLDGSPGGPFLGFAYLTSVLGAALLISCTVSVVLSRWDDKP